MFRNLSTSRLLCECTCALTFETMDFHVYVCAFREPWSIYAYIRIYLHTHIRLHTSMFENVRSKYTAPYIESELSIETKN